MDSLHAFSDVKPNLSHLLPEYIDKVEKAYSLAKSAHLGQYRVSGHPYLVHPLAVANILARLHLDHETIIAGLLHDVVEDTKVTSEDIAEMFGETVASIVDGVTKLNKLDYANVESYHAENYRKMFLAMANDIRVILVKLADRLHNMRTCQVMSFESKFRIAKETLDIYAPIANRLGMHDMSLELYELGFAACYPYRYSVLLMRMYRFSSGHINVLTHLESQIRTQAKALGIAIVEISSREKRLYGIYHKMRMKRLHFSDLMDVFAIRICVSNVAECYQLLGLVHGMYKPKERLFKDYIASPKDNGYQSLHTVLYGPYGLTIEIQIRTSEMHLVATRGVAAHWIYKSGTSAVNLRKHQEWFKKLVEARESCGSDKDFLQTVKEQALLADVYVLTPKGRVLELKRGATVLDMAYHIHTDVGNHAVYAEVDKVVSPLNQELRNGQRVKIYTDSSVFPKESWLSAVVTAKARVAIKASLKERKVVTGRKLGEQMFKRALYVSGVLGEINEDILMALTKVEGVDGVDSFYEKIAADILHLDEMVDEYVRLSKKIDLLEKKSMLVKCEPNDGVEISTCCLPLPGDRIVAVIVDREIKIHRDSCRNQRIKGATTLMAKWDSEIKQTFSCVLRVTTTIQAQNLPYIVSTLTNKKADIEKLLVELDASEKHYVIQLRVKSLEHLAIIIQNMNKIVMVHMVKRELRCG